MTVATTIAVVSAVLAVLALVASALVLKKVRAHQQLLEREIERGRTTFDEIVAQELAQRAEELEHTRRPCSRVMCTDELRRRRTPESK